MKRTEKLINDTLNNLSKKQFAEIVDETLVKELTKLSLEAVCGKFYYMMRVNHNLNYDNTYGQEIMLDVVDLVKEYLEKKGLKL